jgi:hypothetical protein
MFENYFVLCFVNINTVKSSFNIPQYKILVHLNFISEISYQLSQFKSFLLTVSFSGTSP